MAVAVGLANVWEGVEPWTAVALVVLIGSTEVAVIDPNVEAPGLSA